MTASVTKRQHFQKSLSAKPSPTLLTFVQSSRALVQRAMEVDRCSEP